MGKFYLENDIAITSGGITKFETALFGIPTLIVCNSIIEEDLMDTYTSLGIASYAGPSATITGDELRTSFEEFVSNNHKLCKMSEMAFSMLDEYGGFRVIEAIKQLPS